MGEALHQQGYTCLGVRLAGHATRPEDMIRAHWTDWTASVEDGYQILCGLSSNIFLVGLSMGGILSLLMSTKLNVKGVIAMSTPGGDNQDQAMLQVLLNIIDFGMTPQEAVEAPRFQTEHFYRSFGHHEFTPGRLDLEGRIPRAVAEGLTALGHRVSVTGDWSNASAPTVISATR